MEGTASTVSPPPPRCRVDVGSPTNESLAGPGERKQPTFNQVIAWDFAGQSPFRTPGTGIQSIEMGDRLKQLTVLANNLPTTVEFEGPSHPPATHGAPSIQTGTPYYLK